MEYIVKKINKSFDEAKGFFQSSTIPIVYEGESYLAFPHYKGKDRVTEFGGTSSALGALKIVDVNGCKSNYDKVISWLCKKQHSGAWQSKGLYCSHVTAGVLCDLYGYRMDNDILKNAIEYIILCFNEKEGYFYSYPTDKNIPHIYVTFICLKALMLYGEAVRIDTSKIRIWIEKSQNWDGNWGEIPCDSCSSFAFTVYALETLSMCGLSNGELKERYKNQIKWLNRNYTSLYGIYDSEEIIKQDYIDADGITYKEILLQHNCATIVGMFCLEFNRIISSTNIVKKILINQYNGGWGAAHNRLTMWETEANLFFLYEYKRRYIEASRVLRILCNIVYFLSLKLILITISICFMMLSICWIINKPEQIDGLIISLLASAIFSIVGNLIKNEK